jgi:hypothetical protein
MESRWGRFLRATEVILLWNQEMFEGFLAKS